jgi:hypothetical protein
MMMETSHHIIRERTALPMGWGRGGEGVDKESDKSVTIVKDEGIVDVEWMRKNAAVKSDGEAAGASDGKEADSLSQGETKLLSGDQAGQLNGDGTGDESSVLSDKEQITSPMGWGRGGEASEEASTDTEDEEGDKDITSEKQEESDEDVVDAGQEETDEETSVSLNCSDKESDCNGVWGGEKVAPDKETGPSTEYQDRQRVGPPCSNRDDGICCLKVVDMPYVTRTYVEHWDGVGAWQMWGGNGISHFGRAASGTNGCHIQFSSHVDNLESPAHLEMRRWSCGEPDRIGPKTHPQLADVSYSWGFDRPEDMRMLSQGHRGLENNEIHHVPKGNDGEQQGVHSMLPNKHGTGYLPAPQHPACLKMCNENSYSCQTAVTSFQPEPAEGSCSKHVEEQKLCICNVVNERHLSSNVISQYKTNLSVLPEDQGKAYLPVVAPNAPKKGFWCVQSERRTEVRHTPQPGRGALLENQLQLGMKVSMWCHTWNEFQLNLT